jgi:hypothetical protein
MQQDAGSLQQALEHLQTQGIHPDVVRSDLIEERDIDRWDRYRGISKKKTPHTERAPLPAPLWIVLTLSIVLTV